jgi:hypothetical protein
LQPQEALQVITRILAERRQKNGRIQQAAASSRRGATKEIQNPRRSITVFFFPGTGLEKGFDGRFPVPCSQFSVSGSHFEVLSLRFPVVALCARTTLAGKFSF